MLGELLLGGWPGKASLRSDFYTETKPSYKQIIRKRSEGKGNRECKGPEVGQNLILFHEQKGQHKWSVVTEKEGG